MRKCPEDVFLGATREVIFTDSYAREGIQEYIFRIRGLRDYKKTIFVFTTTADVEELFDSEKMNSENVGLDIENLESHLKKHGMIYENRISDVLESLFDKNTGLLIANLDIKDNKIEITGYSVFDDDKKIGFIPADKMHGVNLLLIKDAKVNYTATLKDLRIEFLKKLKSIKIKPRYENNHISFDVSLSLQCEIVSISKTVSITDDMKSELKTMMNGIIKKDIEEAIETSQKTYGVDYFNFYLYFRAKYHSIYEKMNWNEEYKKAKINVNVKSDIKFANLIDLKDGEKND